MLQSIADSLHFDPFIFVCQVVLFIVLTVAMNAVFWKPMLAHLRQRDQGIKNAYKTVEDTRHEMEQLRADYRVRVTAIEAEARTHIQQAIKEAQTERERILSDARAQSDAAIKQGLDAMNLEKAEAFATMRGRMSSMAMTAVGKALGPTADVNALRSTIETSIAAKN